MIRIGVTGKVLAGKYMGWFIRVTLADPGEAPENAPSGYLCHIGQREDLKGGIRAGVFNDFAPNLATLLNIMRGDGIIQGDDIRITWLE